MKKIILASGSPRRKQLLEWAEVPFEIVVRETDETFPAGLNVEEVAIHVARQKAIAVRSMVNNDSVILAADTIVVLNERIIGKPKNREDAINILSDISGRRHRVITGVVIVLDKKEISFSDSTNVYFHAHNEPVAYKLPTGRYGNTWIKILDTSKNFVSEEGSEIYNAGAKITAKGFSVILLKHPLQS